MTSQVPSGAVSAEGRRCSQKESVRFCRTDHSSSYFRATFLHALSTAAAAVVCVLATVAAIALITVALLWDGLLVGMPQLPSREAMWALNRQPAIEFIDTHGETIAVRGPRYGRAVTAASLPQHVVNAFIAAEDKRFREHSGVDYTAILRAVITNACAGHTVQGGSTITQQLVKNLLLDQDQTIKRKVQEAVLASELERVLSKGEILDLYLNRIYLGAGAYGLDAAAQTYFGKTPSTLTLGEAAMLASFPKAPSRFASQIGEASTIDRQHYVLDRMVESGFVASGEAAAAKSELLVYASPRSDAFSGHALDYAVERVHDLLPNPPPDLIIKLTLDLKLQIKAQRAVENGIAKMRAIEGAAIVMENTGALRAMVGGRDYAKSQFNRATQARRQPGSSFKMFVYAAALEGGMTPGTVRDDSPIEIGDWQPHNYNDDYLGPVTLATALSRSLNSVAVQIASEVGPAKVAALARRFGVTSRLQSYPSIALGTDEVTLLDMTTGYGVLAKGGLQMKPYIIEEIRSSQGNLLYSIPTLDSPRIYSRSLAEDMTGMLSRVTTDGTGRAAQVANWEIAGKTGTSQSWRDAWFVGYTTRFVGGVWVGKDDDTPMAKVTGGAIPSRIFSQMMTAALDGIAPETLPGAEHEELMPELNVDTESDQIGASNNLAVASAAETTDGDLFEAPPEEPVVATTAEIGEILTD